jgi:hypothetical protein
LRHRRRRVWDLRLEETGTWGGRQREAGPAAFDGRLYLWSVCARTDSRTQNTQPSCLTQTEKLSERDPFADQIWSGNGLTRTCPWYAALRPTHGLPHLSVTHQPTSLYFLSSLLDPRISNSRAPMTPIWPVLARVGLCPTHRTRSPVSSRETALPMAAPAVVFSGVSVMVAARLHHGVMDSSPRRELLQHSSIWSSTGYWPARLLVAVSAKLRPMFFPALRHPCSSWPCLQQLFRPLAIRPGLERGVY